MKKSFKKQQKHINKIVRKFNKALETDEAFLGRIYIRQYSAACHEFPDGSGSMWFGVLRVYDKVSNTYYSILCDSYNVERELLRGVNEFIVKDLQYDTYRAAALAIDYRDMPHDPSKAEPFYDDYDKNFSYKRYG